MEKKSIDIIIDNQDKSGAYIACPNFDNYKYCWLRDGSFIAYSMDISGNTGSAEAFFQWSHKVISNQKDKVEDLIKMISNGEPLLNSDYLPTRYKLDGQEERDDWPNFQLDGYGTWLWALCRHNEITGDHNLIEEYKTSINTTVDYLINLWSTPNYDCWEENGDKIHPATLACIYGGLESISEYISDKNILETVKKIKNFVVEYCTFDGCLVKYKGSDSIDSSLIWTAIPFKMFDSGDEIVKNTIRKIEKKLVHDYGVHRYPEDTYYGGGEWLIMAGYLGWYYTSLGESDKAASFLKWIENQADENGEMTEQVLFHVNDNSYIEKWRNIWGDTAKPLLWSHAMYLILRHYINIL